MRWFLVALLLAMGAPVMATDRTLTGYRDSAQVPYDQVLDYLREKSTPGDTYSRQGSKAVDVLNPIFAERLSAAIRQAQAEGIPVTIYSAYRPPGMGVGGFRNKFNSMHAYGAAVDVAGIGRPGSETAKRWYQIATANGLYNPYGPDHRKEWNHFQFVPDKVASALMRKTIGAWGPKNSWEDVYAATGLPSEETVMEQLASLGYEGPDAVSRFQADQGGAAGPVDGLAGPQTMAALVRAAENPVRSAARLAPQGSPAMGARVAAEMDVPPSFPSTDEVVQILADRGYTGPDAIMRFQADQMGLAGEGGRTGPDFFAALTNPSEGVLPRPRPGWARGVDASTDAGPPPVGLEGRAAPAGTKPPAGAAPAPGLGGGPAPGIPTPRGRPEGLGARPQSSPEDYRRMRLGDRGADVRTVQAQLAAAGFDPGPLDGIYGPKTARAVMNFQQREEDTTPGAVGGKVDAIAGPFTQARLFDISQNSTMAGLRDPGGVPGGSPSAQEIGRLGWGQEFAQRPPGDFSSSSVEDGFTGQPWEHGDLMMSEPYDEDLRQYTMDPNTPKVGLSIRETRPGPIGTTMKRPFAGKPWAHGDIAMSEPFDAAMTEYFNDPNTPKVGVTRGESPKQPSPLSPTAVIQTLGGTGSSGLGAAGTSGPGPGAGFGGGSDDDDDDDSTSSGYNESFSTTGWI